MINDNHVQGEATKKLYARVTQDCPDSIRPPVGSHHQGVNFYFAPIYSEEQRVYARTNVPDGF